MGTIIEATATATAHERSMSPGALELADAAARSCLDARAPDRRRAGPADQRGRLPRQDPQRAGVRVLDPGGHRREPEPAARRGSRNVLVRRLQRGLWPADGHSAGRRHARLGDGRARHGGRERHGPGAGRLSRVRLSRGRRRGPVERGRLPRGLHGVPVRHVPRVRGAVPELRGLAGGRRARARRITAATSSPSRSPSPTPPGRSSAPSRPPASWRRRRRSTSARSTCSSPRRRSRASPTHWRRDSACPPSGSRRPRTASPARTRPRRLLALESVRLDGVAHDAVRLRGRGDHRRRRALPGVIRACAGSALDGATVARLQALLAPVGARRAPHRSGPPARAATAGEDRGRGRGARQRQRPPEHLHDARPAPAPVPRLAALLGAPDAVRSAAAARHRAGDPAGRVAVSLGVRVAAARADRAARGVDAGRDRGRGREISGGRLHRASADAAGRQRRAARPARALGRDLERRPGESRRPRGDRVVPADRALPGPGVHDRRPRHQRSSEQAVLSPRRRARATPPRTRASCLRRARRSAPR